MDKVRQALLNFSDQLAYVPEVENAIGSAKFNDFIVVGMGGSALAARLLKVWNPAVNLFVHGDYGLPEIPEVKTQNTLVILSSYSGNTEEVIEAFNESRKRRILAAVITSGGKLLELAKEADLPCVKLPGGFEPRFAVGLVFRALLKIIGEETALKKLSEFSRHFQPANWEEKGEQLAKKLFGFVPVIYSSSSNLSLAYNFKVQLNETAKIPAFINAFPELNHNEMSGFDVTEKTKDLFRKFFFVFLKDEADNPRILKRMEVLEKIYGKRELPVEVIPIGNRDIFDKIFGAVVLGGFTAYHLAALYGNDPEKVPLVEEFKKLIRKPLTFSN